MLGLGALENIKVLEQVRFFRAQVPLFGEETGRKNYVRQLVSTIRKISSRVGRNQTTVMRICDRWMQEGTTNRRGRSHPPQCTTSREDRQIVRMAVTNRSVTSRNVAQHIESVAHHSVPFDADYSRVV
ncbi:HTH_Tnp_Tc3_2 domain-containing protein [Trichonephila clavipes]|nr:HTH_Tnp_Tc3_2 domain-containing protein [Trichonephila clavipes]